MPLQALVEDQAIKSSAKLLGWDKQKFWDAKLAAKLIAIGAPIDLNASMQSSSVTTSTHRMVRAYFVCLDRIEVSRIIDETFRMVAEPLPWLKWASGKGYSVDHLLPLITEDQSNNHSGGFEPTSIEKELSKSNGTGRNPDVINGYDLNDLALPQQLIAAFGPATGMDDAWFQKVEGPLLRARIMKGQIGRSRSIPPYFCPYLVMDWLIDPKRKKGKSLSAQRGWKILKANFPRVHDTFQMQDPNEY